MYTWTVRCIIAIEKGGVSEKVMYFVAFDKRFNYAFSSWEGSTSDSSVLQDAVYKRPHNRLRIPTNNTFFNYNFLLFTLYTFLYFLVYYECDRL